MEHNISQGLPQLADKYSPLHTKQQHIVELIKRQQIEPRMQVLINQNIPGLRKKAVPFAPSPANRRWWLPISSLERNGILNVGLSANWTRIAFPMLMIFYINYMLQPITAGVVYINENNNFQWEPIYHKMGSNRAVYTD